MPWYGWVILVVAGVVVLAAIALRAFRASRRGRRFLALSTRAKLDFGRELLRDPQVPLTAKVALIVLVGYLALPFDLIPDFIPVLGQADDVLVVVAAVGLLILSVPRERFDAALEEAETAEDRRRVRRAAAV
ncbi:MAG: DUF1232 domain-containing protein [Dehalococcoidia bacterium]|nr:DUF1232 domain-containing protein [Dehalococcoidia bacterium]